MPKAIKAQVNGAAMVGEKLSAELGIKAPDLAAVAQVGGPLAPLALVTSFISRVVLEVGESTVSVQQQISQDLAALTKAAAQSGNASDPMQVVRAVLPKINAARANLEQLCSKQLAFWQGISRRLSSLGEITKDQASKL